ncbi:hypothetical protein FOA52_015161 [Chlamydomonas sp. UWO 241]|nr:hypothetical protein FOA52_015161 [Chlamydomonas sp. UWO 241]
MSARLPTADAPDASGWSGRRLRDEAQRLGSDARGCVEKQDLVTLVINHQQSTPAAAARSGGQTAGRAHGFGVEELGSSGSAGPSVALFVNYFDTAQCENCSKIGADVGHKLLKCSGCRAAYYCSKECQNESWKSGAHKKICKQNQADKAVGAESGQAEVFAAIKKWVKKMKIVLTVTACSALLVLTPKIATYALVLRLEHVPSKPFKFKLQKSEVLTKDELLATYEHGCGLREQPPWDRPGPDRRAAVVVAIG